MDINTQLSGSMVLLLLFILTEPLHACYYEGDPVWTGTHYDVPPTVKADGSCYYSGDPVQITVGQYDNPIFFADNSYYTADEQEVSSHAQVKDTNSESEFSAFEDQDNSNESSKKNDNKNQTIENNNNDWTPGAWDLNY